MADYSPSWEAIAGKWADVLRDALGWVVYSPYPNNAVDAIDLPCVIINEPTDVSFGAFTFGAITVTYTGDISLLVRAIDTGQARPMSGDINAITAAALALNIAVHNNRTLGKTVSQLSLADGKIARLSPYDDDARGHYIGLSVPYMVKIQHGSRS